MPGLFEPIQIHNRNEEEPILVLSVFRKGGVLDIRLEEHGFESNLGLLKKITVSVSSDDPAPVITTERFPYLSGR